MKMKYGQILKKTCNLLGKYATEQRAKEVLAEIYKKYSDWQSMRMIKNEEIQAKIVSGDNSKYFDVYMTPEEQEENNEIIQS